MSPSRPTPFGPGRLLRGKPVYGGQPLPLPLAAAIGVNNLTASGANLVGSVNPQGQAGSWWMVYGPTPQFGASSTAQPLTTNSLPQTVTAQISGLTAGTVYYFAVVASTAAGRVTSAPLSFTAGVPAQVTNASQPVPSTGTPTVAIPHWRFPITFNAATGVGVVEQDTLDEVYSNVQAILACPIGACPELPTFGRPDLWAGLAPLDPAPVIQAVQRLEPRATETAVSTALGDPNAGGWQIALTTQYSGAQ